MLWAVFMAVIIITGTAPTSPARKRYWKIGKTWWTRKFTILIVALLSEESRKKREFHQWSVKHGLLKSVLSAQHSLQGLDSRAALQRIADTRFPQTQPVFPFLGSDGATALCAAARSRRRRR